GCSRGPGARGWCHGCLRGAGSWKPAYLNPPVRGGISVRPGHPLSLLGALRHNPRAHLIAPSPSPQRIIMKLLKSIPLLGWIVLAIVAGILLGPVMPLWLGSVFLTYNSIFSGVLGFVVPLIIFGLVAPAIA